MEELGRHDLAAYARALEMLDLTAKRILGAGIESVAIEVAVPRYWRGAEFPQPQAVLKITKPFDGHWRSEWGHRTFDAKIYHGPEEIPLETGPVNVYLQELVDVPGQIDPDSPMLAAFFQKVKDFGRGELDTWDVRPGQIGVRANDEAVLVDYPAVGLRGRHATPEEIVQEMEAEMSYGDSPETALEEQGFQILDPAAGGSTMKQEAEFELNDAVAAQLRKLPEQEKFEAMMRLAGYPEDKIMREWQLELKRQARRRAALEEQARRTALSIGLVFGASGYFRTRKAA